MKRISSSILFILFILSTVASAQNVAPSWTNINRRTGDNSDRFNKIISDGAGNFVGVGYTIRQGNYRDFLTLKFNANGDTMWSRTKNGKGNADDEAVSAAVDASGNVYVVGFSDEDITQNDIRIIKYDPTGLIVLWDTLWDSPSSLDDVPVDLKIDGSGNCIIGGIARPDTFTGSRDYITLKYDPNGILLWSQQYTNPLVLHGKDEISGITLDSLDNVYVTGRSANSNGNDDFVTLKYDAATGSQVWLRTYDAGSDDRSSAIITDHAGNIIITGSSNNGNNNDYRTIKYDLNGNPIWIKVYNAPVDQDDNPTAIAVDASNNVIVTGESDVNSSAIVDLNFQTIKYNSIGTPLWSVRTPGPIPDNPDRPNSIAVDGNGNIFVTGKCDKNIIDTVTDNDFMTVMYNASGTVQWGGAKYFEGTRFGDDDIASSVITDGLGNVYVAGGAVDSITQKNATVIKYDIATGDTVWVKNFNGEGDFRESTSSIVIDANNYSYVAGYTFAENNNLNGIIAKIDPNGNTVCSFIYKGKKNDDDEFSSIAISANGSIYAAGYTKVTNEKSNMLLVKWDPNTCDTVWSWNYDYIGQSERAISIVLDVAGNIYLTGRSDSDPQDTISNYDIVTFKFDSNGNILWQAPRFNGTGNLKDEPTKIILDNSGDVIVGGKTANIHDDDFVILKYNSVTGAPVWAQPVRWASQHANDDRVNDIVVDGFNNIFVCGYAQQGSGNVPNDAVVVKYDSAGNNITASYIIGDDKDEAVRLGVDANNNVYCVFKFDADGGIPLQNNYDYLLKKFDNELLELWTIPAQYDSPIHQDDIPSDLIISPSGDVFITGTSENDTSGGRTNNNWVTIGYDGLGAQIFISNWDGPNATDDAPHAIAIRGQSMWVCGNSEGPGNNQKDITVNEYYPLPVDIAEINDAYKSVAYPNPFSNDCEILINKYVPKATTYLEVYDMLGNSVMTPQIINGNSTRLHRNNLASGIYEYRIVSNVSLISRGKLIIN